MPRSFAVVAAAALLLVATTGSARAEDAVPVRVFVTAAAAIDVDLGRVIAETPPQASSLRLDGALFAGLASAGFVVAEAPGAEAPAAHPMAGLSPRLLRGGGVVCDVRVSF